MAKQTIVAKNPPKIGEQFAGLTRNFEGVADGCFVNTSKVVGMDIITGWVKTKSGSTYYFERYNEETHKFLGTPSEDKCILCSVHKDEHK